MGRVPQIAIRCYVAKYDIKPFDPKGIANRNVCKTSIFLNNVAYRPVAMRQSLNNARVGRSNRRTVFSMWSVQRCYKQGTDSVVISSDRGLVYIVYTYTSTYIYTYV
jgi:hypothetical protein